MGTHLSPVFRRWYHRLPAVTAEIDCGGAGHRITWRRGRLVLEDHDALAEESLAALGAKPPMCLELLELWRRRRGSELLYDLLLGEGTLSREELELMRASHETEVERAQSMSERMPAHFRHQGRGVEMVRLVERQAVERLERERQMWAVTLAKIMPPGLRRRLGLSVIVNIERHWEDYGFRHQHVRHVEPVLTALATPLFEQSVSSSKRTRKRYRGLPARTALLAPGEFPTCAMRVDRGGPYAALSLPLSWFTEVWARGIALVDGCFVMSVEDGSADGTSLRVAAVRLKRRGWRAPKSLEAPALLTRDRGGVWHLQWLWFENAHVDKSRAAPTRRP